MIYNYEETTPSSEIGVIIGRFQVDNLHEGHINLIQNVVDRHERVLILIGTTELMSTKRNPLDYVSRELMIKEKFPNVFTSPIQDKSYSNDEWSKSVDTTIRKTFQRGSILLYGSRDSFIDYYSGKFNCVELPSVYTKSGTDIRERVSNGLYNSIDFRAGCIYSFYNVFDKAEVCVDGIIFDKDKQRVLLGKKNGRTAYQFIGGFVDTSDDNFTTAIRREVHEETGILIDTFERIGDMKVQDSRFASEVNKLFTTVFVGYYVHGRPIPQDDIDELRWFLVHELNYENIIKTHHPILDLFKNWYSTPHPSSVALKKEMEDWNTGTSGIRIIPVDKTEQDHWTPDKNPVRFEKDKDNGSILKTPKIT